MMDMVDIDGEDFIFSVDTAPSLPEFSSPSSPSSYSSSSPSLSSSFHLDLPTSGVGDVRRVLLKSAVAVETSPPQPEKMVDGSELFCDFDLHGTGNPFTDDYGNNTNVAVYNKDIAGGGKERSSNSSENLGTVFLEWLKNNKDAISPEDLRSIKLKRSTIECAARHLGGGKEGMKRLLKLILDWVQNHHLQKRKRQHQELLESRFPLQQSHIPYAVAVGSPATAYCNGVKNGVSTPFSPPFELHNIDNQGSSWPQTSAERSAQLGSSYTEQSSVGNSSILPQRNGILPGSCGAQPQRNGILPGSCGAQPPYQQAKEARKKRMARHRRSSVNANCI